MAKLKLDEAIAIRTDYLSNLSVKEISEKYKISQDKVKKVLNARDETARRLAEENIQLKFNKQTDAIQNLVAQGLQFLTEAVESARNSEEPHLVMDKVSSAIEKMDRIARLNLNRATDISEKRTTNVSIDVAETLKQLDTPEKQKDFLQGQLKIYGRDNKNNERTTTTVT